MKVGGQRLLKCPAEQQPGTSFLLLPAINVAIPVLPRAGEIVAELGIAVDHHATSGSAPSGSLAGGTTINSSQSPAGAKASRFIYVRPFTVVWETLITPWSPTRRLSSSSSRPSSSVS